MDATRRILVAVARADAIACTAARLPWGSMAAAWALVAWGYARGGRKLYWDRIVKAVAAALGAVAGLFGEWNAMLTILVVVMGADYVSGLIVAACGKSPKTAGGRLSSKAGFVGIAKKVLMMLLVGLATLVDRALGNTAMVFQTSLTFYYIANEGLSILENAALLDVRFPEGLKRALETMRERADERDEK